MTILHRLIGIYDADGTFRGEVAYWVGARLGRRHCALCDITHGAFRERADWQACQRELPVPFETYHRNDMPAAVRALHAALPAVFAETDTGIELLLDPEAIRACNRDPQALVDALVRALSSSGIDAGEPDPTTAD